MFKIKAHTKRKIRRGTKLVTKLIEATGIPDGYSATIAWFAERMVLAFLCLMVLSFALGVIFVLRWSEPIGNSRFYNAAATTTEEGIRTFSQQVIDITSPILAAFVKDNRQEVDLVATELAVRKSKLKAYLISKHSPFADDETTLDAFVASKNMRMMVAISFVESTYGQHCYYYNCSGIGGTPPTLRKYNNYAEWVKDFDQLLEKRYKNVPPEKFIGFYVQPGSPNWIYGVKQVLREFNEQGIE